MKNFFLLVFIGAAVATLSSIMAQPPGAAPPGAGDTNLSSSDGLKARSIELERIKREADKQGKSSAMSADIESKFPQIRKDFEGMQIAESAIIKAYTTGDKINYKLIEISAKEVNKSAKHLNSNLFAPDLEKEKPRADAVKPKELKEMIMELDKAIGGFLSSKMFINLKAVDVEVAKKARKDLFDVIDISSMLADSVSKMK